MSSYFNLASFARAKKNTDQLQKSNPQHPVLNDEDERFLERQVSEDKAAKSQPTNDAETTEIAEDGAETPATQEEQKAAGQEQLVIPAKQPESPETPASPDTVGKQAKKKSAMELPSQEEAESITGAWNDQVKVDNKKTATGGGDKRTWASYIPSTLIPNTAKKEGDINEPTAADSSSPTQQNRTWKEYASAYIPTSPTSWFKSKDADAKAEPVYNDDGTVNEAATKEKQENEFSVLLDNLNMSSINNRVFALSDSTHDIYERFALVLKDTINGGPTAYQDMDKLMRDAGPQLEKQFQSMPPFVRTLVKSLPAKIGTTLAPEMLAAASEKPGHDLNERLKTASAGGQFADKAASIGGKAAEPSGKKKRRIPGLKSLISKEGAVATILRNTVVFLQTRFPFLASMTNVVMSLAVFILMFVFWYCHKRGKEVRLAKDAEQAGQDGAGDGEGEDDDDDDDDDDIDDEEDSEEGEETKDLEEMLAQADPKDVPLPQEDLKT